MLKISKLQHLHPILHPKVRNWVFLYILNAAWRRLGSWRWRIDETPFLWLGFRKLQRSDCNSGKSWVIPWVWYKWTDWGLGTAIRTNVRYVYNNLIHLDETTDLIASTLWSKIPPKNGLLTRAKRKRFSLYPWWRKSSWLEAFQWRTWKMPRLYWTKGARK